MTLDFGNRPGHANKAKRKEKGLPGLVRLEGHRVCPTLRWQRSGCNHFGGPFSRSAEATQSWPGVVVPLLGPLKHKDTCARAHVKERAGTKTRSDPRVRERTEVCSQGGAGPSAEDKPRFSKQRVNPPARHRAQGGTEKGLRVREGKITGSAKVSDKRGSPRWGVSAAEGPPRGCRSTLFLLWVPGSPHPSIRVLFESRSWSVKSFLKRYERPEAKAFIPFLVGGFTHCL